MSERKDKGILHQVRVAVGNNIRGFFQWQSSLQITDTKAIIEKTYYRISVLERLLAAQEMENDRRDEVEAELEALKKILKDSEKEIETLHFTNRETTKIAAAVMFVVVFIFCIYALLTNTNDD